MFCLTAEFDLFVYSNWVKNLEVMHQNIPFVNCLNYIFSVLSPLSKIRTHRLKFENKCCNDKYSRHDIMADDGSPIKVAIYDQENGVITNGPLSSIQVRIVVLDGEFNKENKEQWSENSFKTSIVHCRPGKQPLFANELYLRLENGVAPLCGVKFQDNSSFVPSKKFRLGAMADDDNISEKILEGISESFAVKDGRGYRKFFYCSIYSYMFPSMSTFLGLLVFTSADK